MRVNKPLLGVAQAASLIGNLYYHHQLRVLGERPLLRIGAGDEQIVMRTRGGLLEVSSIKSTEHFESSSEHRIVGVPVGTTINRIRVPAVFRYHIALAPEWKIIVRDGTVIVVAPAVQASLPVAIDTAGIEKQAFGVWSVFTGAAELDQLQRSVSQALATQAMSANYIAMQRSAARQTVTEFVSKWLLTQQRFRGAPEVPVRVFFADEPIGALDSLAPPVLLSPHG